MNKIMAWRFTNFGKNSDENFLDILIIAPNVQEASKIFQEKYNDEHINVLPIGNECIVSELTAHDVLNPPYEPDYELEEHEDFDGGTASFNMSFSPDPYLVKNSGPIPWLIYTIIAGTASLFFNILWLPVLAILGGIIFISKIFKAILGDNNA